MSKSLTLPLPEGVDKLSGPQKGVAVFIGLTLLAALYVVLPSVAFFLKNLWAVIFLALPIAYIVTNPYFVWSQLTTLSWKLTKSFIGLDVISSLERYADWADLKHTRALQTRQKQAVNYERVKAQVDERKASYERNMQTAVAAESAGRNPVEIARYTDQAQIDMKFVEEFSPLVVKAKENLDRLDKSIQALAAEKETTKYNIEALKVTYESMKTMRDGMAETNDFLQGNNEPTKVYNETVRQIADRMYNFNAEVQTFENNMQPVLDKVDLDKTISAQKGQELLAQYKASNPKQLTAETK